MDVLVGGGEVLVVSVVGVLGGEFGELCLPVGELGGWLGVVVTVTPGGGGLPAGSVTGVFDEPGGGRRVTVSVPSGPTLITAVAEEGRLVSLSVAGSPADAVLDGTTCVEPGVSLPALTLEACLAGATSWAMVPNAVASATPLTASNR